MVHCVVYGCNNKSNSGRSFHLFPNRVKEKDLYRQWLIKIGRASSATGQLWQPSDSARICSDHFEPACYNKDPRIVASIGYSGDRCLRLQKGSIPTIFPQQEPEPHSTPVRGGFEKRKRQRVLKELLENVEPVTTQPMSVDDSTCSTEIEVSLPRLHSPAASPSSGSTAIQATPRTYVKTTQTTTTSTDEGVQTIYSFTSHSNKGTMTDSAPVLIDVAVQCELQDTTNRTHADSAVDEDISDDDDEFDDDDDDDRDWHPDDASETSDESDHEDDEIVGDIIDAEDESPVSMPKYIVFESALKELFDICRTCNLRCRIVKKCVGILISIEAVCPDGHIFQWNSQPKHNKMPVGNLVLAGSVLFSGASPGLILKFLQCANISSFSERTYRYIQSSYLIPAVDRVWNLKQTEALLNCEGRNVKLGGDARCCSPGHTAKYGSYSLMDLETGLVLDVQLVQATEVPNSYSMEKEGLERGLQALKNRNIRVTDLTTDRHVQVRKFMSTEHTNINHWFDVWHVAKGIYKKLQALSKKRGCESVAEWAQSISNHLYWAAATSGGDGELVKQKWKSVTNHVVNVHEGHGDRFPRCLHGDLDRNWIRKDSKPHKELKELLTKTRLVNDVQKLSPAEQTSQLEAYHKVVCQFAPKFQHFFYASMKARLLIAAMHSNENCRRGQAVKRDGTPMWKLSYPKGKHGEHTLKKVKTPCTYGYAADLLEKTWELRIQYPTYRRARVLRDVDVPRPSTDFANRVSQDEAVLRHRSRFNV